MSAGANAVAKLGVTEVQAIFDRSPFIGFLGLKVLGLDHGTSTFSARMPLRPGEAARMRRVRFRTLGCWPLTAAIDSDADSLEAVVREVREAAVSERQGRAIDHDPSASMEQKKREGYF